MFWKFGFQSASSIDTLLDREDVALEHILDEDDLLQECKSQNTRLIDYFQRMDVLKRLLGYVSGEIEGEERGRFKYPYVATEVLCSEIWSIVETCTVNSTSLLAPWWDYVLDITPEDMKSKATVASHFAKINSVFLSKKPDEMLQFIQSQPSVIERLLNHLETPSFIDLFYRILQLDEHPGNMGVVEWLSAENLIPRLISFLSPSNSPDKQTVAADFIKGIIALSAPSGNFPVNPSSLTMAIGNEISPLPTSNRLARELAQEDNLLKLMGYMLDDFPLEPKDTQNKAADNSDYPDYDEKLPSTASATSSLMNSMSIFIELIRKNNSDYYEPYLFHTIRRRLIQTQQQQAYPRHMQSEDEEREELEHAMAEVVDHIGVVHLGGLLSVVGRRLKDLQRLLRKPRSSTTPIATTVGGLVPLTFERFRICELYAELLHCSNMALLNRQPGFGPVYDKQGRLVGGLACLETMAKVMSAGSAPESPSAHDQSLPEEEEDPASLLTGSRETPVPGSSINSADVSSIGSYEDATAMESSSDDISDNSDLHDSVLEEIHFDEDEATTRGKDDEHSKAENTSPVMPHPNKSASQSDQTLKAGSSPPPINGDSSDRTPGDALKAKFLELEVVPTLLDLFFDFPLNNFLHNVVYDLLHQIVTGRVDKGFNRELVISLFRDSRILHRIVDGQKKNDEACSKPKGVRLGYMGHLTLISEDIVTAFEHYPPELIDVLSSYSPLEEWDEYVGGKYKETKDKDTSQLGGGRPVLGLGVGPIAGMGRGSISKRVDEGDEFEARKEGTIKQVTGDAASAEQNADEGSSGQFARYLAHQIQSSDQFSSASTDSDDDDDDSGWLEEGHGGFQYAESTGDFDLRAPAALSRQQFAASFEDPFRPTDVSTSSDAHSDDDDAWGPFSDSAAPNDTSGSFSSSFTFSPTSDDDGFSDSFGDDFGDFQTATAPASLDAFDSTKLTPGDDGGGRTPTPGTTSFGFESDFEATIFGTPSTSSTQLEPTEGRNHAVKGDKDGSGDEPRQPTTDPLPASTP